MLVWAACCWFCSKKRKSWCWSSFAQAQEDTFSLQIFGVRAGTICSTSAGSACQSHIREREDISWWNTEKIQTNKSTLPCPFSCSPPHYSWRCVTVTLLSNSVSTAVYTDQTQACQSYQGLSCLSIIYSPGIPPPPTFKCFEISFPQKALPIRKNHRSHNLDALKSLRSDWADHPIYWDQMVK